MRLSKRPSGRARELRRIIASISAPDLRPRICLAMNASATASKLLACRLASSGEGGEKRVLFNWPRLASSPIFFSAANHMGSTAAEEEEHDIMMMQEIDIHDFARQLLEAHGDKAVAEAAQRACALEKEGKNEEAKTWRHIEAALKTMRGPHES